ncbi:nitrite reductase/ring-hydroxylating ferredoxin subunit [Methylobacter tundripaludum]|uniref:Nitrite reductase/ring-hydroxylating ferredoxin subunit n=1 Tax=Methylobacter tundripaludum TaxID=173365 RepID=A0A2S6GXV8_9GAMM|nr:Rieske 2Fe-2S domain-containing protein [Methylobacter tundripaludum]PPK70038.1 nitrite reductase/ring-hydroxylating ferredoxin subunit [Methylobacter tundripaludum]
MADDNAKLACTRDELDKASYLTRKICFKKQPVSAIIFAFEGSVYAYVNHCMHMHRPLNCEQDAIFDETGLYLRCSMHGFIFDPKTGECQSPVCLGQRLQSLRLKEIDGVLYFAEKHLTLID